MNSDSDREKARERVDADRKTARRDRASQAAWHRGHRQFIGRVHKDFGSGPRALERGRQGQQHQDRAVAPVRFGEISPTMTVATAATTILRISAPSPTYTT